MAVLAPKNHTARIEAGDAVLAAARRGVHVICEKPLEITLRRIDRLIAACAKAGITQARQKC